MNSFYLYSALVWRQLRGSRSGLWLMVLCLLLASLAMGVVGLLGESVRSAIESDGQRLLGGDVEIELEQRAATPKEIQYIQKNSLAYSEVISLSSMARLPDEALDSAVGVTEALVSLKSIDDLYPLVGVLTTDQGVWNPEEISAALARDTQGHYGAILQPILLERLGLKVGDTLELGNLSLQVRAAIVAEPDPSFGSMVFGPTVLISDEAMRQSGLIQPGSLFEYSYRLLLPVGASIDSWRGDFAAAFGQAGWRVRDYTRPMRNAERGLDRTLMFLSLATLITVVSAGIGISNGVRRFLQTHIPAIASLRVVGATRGDIITIYGLLISLVAFATITLGMLLSVASLFVLLPLVETILPITIPATLHPWPIFYSYINGFLLSMVAAMLVIFAAADTNPGVLFRQVQNTLSLRLPGSGQTLAFALIVAAFLLVNIGIAERPDLAAIFLAGSTVLLLALALLSRLLVTLSRGIKPQQFIGRFALANLARPGAVTSQVVVSLGLGLTVLVLIGSLSSNVTSRMNMLLENEAPSFYFIDIQADELEQFTQLMQPYAATYDTTPMLRGRITHVAGVPVAKLPKNEEFDWITRGDRAFTWSPTWEGRNAQYAPIVEGEWWPADYDGSMQVSFDAEAAAALDLSLGDTLGLNILGRNFKATITSFRKIEWEGMGINFVVVVSPGIINQAPHTNIASVTVAPDLEAKLQSEVVRALPNVSAIRLKDIFDELTSLLSRMVLTIQSIGGVSIVVGIAVLISALIAVQAQKSYENHLLRVLGADRRRLFLIIMLELALLGTVAGLVAAISGHLLGWGIVQWGLGIDYTIDVAGTLLTILLGQAVTIVFGMTVAWRDLDNIDVRHLRNE